MLTTFNANYWLIHICLYFFKPFFTYFSLTFPTFSDSSFYCSLTFLLFQTHQFTNLWLLKFKYSFYSRIVWQSLARSRARRDSDLRDKSREIQEKSLTTEKLVQKLAKFSQNWPVFHCFYLGIVISTYLIFQIAMLHNILTF